MPAGTTERTTLRGMLFAATILVMDAAMPALAQDPSPVDTTEAAEERVEIKLIYQSYGDSVVLRWAPNRVDAWFQGNRVGYVVTRTRVTENGPEPETLDTLTPEPLRPWTLSEWKAKVKPGDDYAAIAAQMLYGDFSEEATEADEGNPFAQMIAESEVFDARFGMALLAADNEPLAADGLALRYVDAMVMENERYIYRVSLAVEDSTRPVASGYSVAYVYPYSPLAAPPGLTVEEGDGSITVRWPIPELTGFTGYHLFRSDDGGSTYTQLTEQPLISIVPENQPKPEPLLYTDSAVSNYTVYTYQLRGLNAFGDLSEPAELTAMPRDLTATAAPQILTPEQVGERAIQLDWTMGEDEEDLAGFVVERSETSSSGFEAIDGKLLSTSERSYVDRSASNEHPYYRVVAIDTAGNRASSIAARGTFADSIPPGAPTGVRGVIDTNGIVRLSWNRNTERDILGYRVLWANADYHEFSQRTAMTLADTTFVDTVSVRTLTENVYYQVAAVDRNYNHSEPSEPIEIRRPDLVAPQKSLFTNVSVTDSSVALNWIPSPSSDVARNILYRRAPDADKEWSELQSMGQSTASYTDDNVEQNVVYHYRLVAEDSSGLRSAGDVVQGRPYDPGVRAGVAGLRASYDSATDMVRLVWDYPGGEEEEHWFVLYRAIGTAEIAQYQSVAQGISAFEDSYLPAYGTYTYAVQVYTHGGISPISSPATVVVPE